MVGGSFTSTVAGKKTMVAVILSYWYMEFPHNGLLPLPSEDQPSNQFDYVTSAVSHVKGQCYRRFASYVQDQG